MMNGLDSISKSECQVITPLGRFHAEFLPNWHVEMVPRCAAVLRGDQCLQIKNDDVLLF